MEDIGQSHGWVRAFIAIELPPAVKEALSSLQGQLRSGLREQGIAKWVAPGSIHLTLKFLGNVNPAKLPDIERRMSEAAKEFACLRLQLSGLGAFPNLKRVQVIWVGIEGDIERLSQLQERVETDMERMGFGREGRSFSPHLTLARLKDRVSLEDKQTAGRLIASTAFTSSVAWEATELCLMRSQLTPAGAIYSRLFAASLSTAKKS